jgi:antitoxin (DNA-binding transcriptional repressor) of toxin-antitoxin stability system
MAGLTSVGVREFRENLGRYLALVKDGGAIAITSHGKTVAELRAPAVETKAPMRTVGGLKGKIWMADDWDEWDEETLAAFDAPIDPQP